MAFGQCFPGVRTEEPRPSGRCRAPGLSLCLLPNQTAFLTAVSTRPVPVIPWSVRIRPLGHVRFERCVLFQPSRKSSLQVDRANHVRSGNDGIPLKRYPCLWWRIQTTTNRPCHQTATRIEIGREHSRLCSSGGRWIGAEATVSPQFGLKI